MLMPMGLVVLGLVFLVVGGEILLRGAVGLATVLRLTPAVIGLTVVAAGTSVPEFAVSAVAAIRGSEDIAVANVVGSNIFNLAFILGLGALIKPLAIIGNTIRLEYPVLALVTLLYFVNAHDGVISRGEGLLFVAIYVGFTAYLVRLVRAQMNAQEESGITNEVNELLVDGAGPSMLRCAVFILAGIALLGLGAQSTVMGATELARLWGMSERVIGLTIVAAGTGLPEVVTTIVSGVRGRDDVAIGNVIGSNLFNILGTLGIGSIIRPVTVSKEIAAFDNLWLLGITVVVFPILCNGRRILRWEGCVLLAVYAVYLGMLLSR